MPVDQVDTTQARHLILCSIAAVISIRPPHRLPPPPTPRPMVSSAVSLSENWRRNQTSRGQRRSSSLPDRSHCQWKNSSSSHLPSTHKHNSHNHPSHAAKAPTVSMARPLTRAHPSVDRVRSETALVAPRSEEPLEALPVSVVEVMVASLAMEYAHHTTRRRAGTVGPSLSCKARVRVLVLRLTRPHPYPMSTA